MIRPARALSSPTQALALAPQPGIEELGDLLEQARAAGLPVSFTVSGVPRPVPQGEALAVYRVVQESLTNIRKHAGPGVTAAVSLGYADEGLVIRVTDDGRGAAARVPQRGWPVPGTGWRACGNGSSCTAGQCDRGREPAAGTRSSRGSAAPGSGARGRGP